MVHIQVHLQAGVFRLSTFLPHINPQVAAITSDDLDQRCPTFWAPGTSFMAAIFPRDQEEVGFIVLEEDSGSGERAVGMGYS